MTVSIDKIMETALILASPEETVGEIRDKMSAHDIGAVPVVSAEGVLVGIVTSDDLVEDYPATLPVSRVMTAPVRTIPPEADARVAVRLMLETRHHHVVVMSDDRVVGIVSSLDLLQLVEPPGGGDEPGA